MTSLCSPALKHSYKHEHICVPAAQVQSSAFLALPNVRGIMRCQGLHCRPGKRHSRSGIEKPMYALYAEHLDNLSNRNIMQCNSKTPSFCFCSPAAFLLVISKWEKSFSPPVPSLECHTLHSSIFFISTYCFPFSFPSVSCLFIVAIELPLNLASSRLAHRPRVCLMRTNRFTSFYALVSLPILLAETPFSTCWWFPP